MLFISSIVSPNINSQYCYWGFCSHVGWQRAITIRKKAMKQMKSERVNIPTIIYHFITCPVAHRNSTIKTTNIKTSLSTTLLMVCHDS